MQSELINTFTKEGYDAFVSTHWIIPARLTWVLGTLLFLLGASIFASLLPKGLRLRWSMWLAKRPARSLCLQFFCIWLAFAFFYHGLFQCNPHNFKLNAPIENAALFSALEEHRRVVDNARAAEAILSLTLDGLRTAEGSRLLDQLADRIGGKVRSTYVAALSICVVGPPSLLNEEDAAFYTRAFGNRKEATELIRAQRATMVTKPGLLATLPAWTELEHVETQDLRNMLDLTRVYLAGTGAAGGKLQNYATKEDSQRLGQYLTRQLAVTVERNSTVDVGTARDAIELRRIMHEAMMELGAGRRFIDFLYFSLITIATVGYGDILPNSTTARLVVVLEIILGTITLVFQVAYYVGRGDSSQRREGASSWESRQPGA